MHGRIFFAVFGLALMGFVSGCGSKFPEGVSPYENKPRKAQNVILLIGDGMGFSHVEAAASMRGRQEMDFLGEPPAMAWENLPILGTQTTFADNAFVTDSAAAGTALATGEKTRNGVISMKSDMRTELTTIAEMAKAKGKAVGLISSVPANHATPAAFYAKEPSRQNYDNITRQAFERGIADVVLGGGLNGDMEKDEVVRLAEGAGYKVFTLENYTGLTPGNLGSAKAFGYFDQNGNGHLDYESEREAGNPEPVLADMTRRTLDILETKSDQGFFLMVEGGAIDWAAHGNDETNVIGEVYEFEKAYETVIDWLEEKGQLGRTLIIVTADHETGGLTLTGPTDVALGQGSRPEFSWGSKGHTAIPVPVYATGPGSRLLAGKQDSTNIFRVMAMAIGEGD